MAEQGGMLGLKRGFEVLMRLSSEPAGVTFSALKELGVSAPTLSRLLKAMVEMGAVEKNAAGCYCLGKATHNLARAVLGQLPREELIKPVLEQLAAETGESAAYYENCGGRLIVKAKVEVSDSFHYMSVGGENRQFYHGFRMAMLPFLGSEERQLLVERTDELSVADDGYEDELARIFAEGVCYETCETATGFQRIAAPVFCRGIQAVGKRCVGSIGITFVKGRYEERQLADLKAAVQRAAWLAMEKI